MSIKKSVFFIILHIISKIVTKRSKKGFLWKATGIFLCGKGNRGKPNISK